MKNDYTIYNDPIYGLVEMPKGILHQLTEHQYFQRLRRISQLGFTHYVYPGAIHSRFNHALGALHLMRQAIQNLRRQGVEITDEEKLGASIAILLHDIGHAPFSHSLEFVLLDIHHEKLSVLFMELLNEEFEGQLDIALQIFQDTHPKRFLHQLVSSQLDMDRMDYLTRDSFFTGVSEGVIGYDRLLKMLEVHENELVISYKGTYSVEKFLIARRSMYWQVYLHKTVSCASEMLIKAIARARFLLNNGEAIEVSAPLLFFLKNRFTKEDFASERANIAANYALLDDCDIMAALKAWRKHSDPILSYLASCILDRKLLRVKAYENPIRRDLIEKNRLSTMEHFGISLEDSKYLVFSSTETNKAYEMGETEIKIRLKNGQLRPISKWREHNIQPKEVAKYYLYYPKVIST